MVMFFSYFFSIFALFLKTLIIIFYMANVIKLRKGIDIRLDGAADPVYGEAARSEMIGLVPDDFQGIVPKPVVKPGEAVKVGTVLFVDKNRPDVKVVSPVSGVLEAVNRGDRRKIMSIVVKNDGKMTSESVEAFKASSADEAKKWLSDAGMFAFIKQRPYDVIADPADAPKAIFVSTFDVAPLAPDFDFIFSKDIETFKKGLSVLAKVAPVYVGVQNGSCAFAGIEGENITVATIDGKYPASNVGVLINHTNPVNKGEVVWTIGAQEVVYVGRAAAGTPDFSKVVALVGPEVVKPAHYKMVLGQKLSDIVSGSIKEGVNARIISGNPLSGCQTSAEGFLAPFVNQITAIKEGDDVHELIGWLMPRFNMFSNSCTYLTKLISLVNPKKTYKTDTRILGGQRHMIFSGEYDKVFPMDIYPEYLIKAIIAGDIDRMEQLGIYEVAPEDFAAAEYVCSSKVELQRIVREGLDKLRKEMC